MLTGYSTDGEEIWEYEDEQTHEMDPNHKVHDLVPSVSEEFSNLIHATLDPLHRNIQHAEDQSGHEKGWLNQLDIISSGIPTGITSSVTQPPSFPRGVLPKKTPHVDLPQPHIICNGKRFMRIGKRA